MIDTQPQFVSPEDFLNYWSKDLNVLLRDNSNISNKADIFLKRVEDRLMSWIDANTFRLIPWDYYKDGYVYKSDNERKNAEILKDYWKKAILTQAMYIYRNSNIGMDSGYDPEKGMVATYSDLSAIEICRPTIDLIKQAGLYNHVVRNTFRHTTLH